jgi:ribosomal protein L5
MGDYKERTEQDRAAESLQEQIDRLTSGKPAVTPARKSLRDFVAEKMAEDKAPDDKTGES